MNFCGIESRDLDKNAIIPNWTDNRFAGAKIIDPFANNFDSLVEHAFGHVLIPFQANEEGRSALNIEAERDLFLWRPDRDDAECDEKQHQCGCEQAFPRPLVGGEVPPEKNEHDKSDKKCERGSHRIFDFRVSIFDLIIASRLTLQRFSRPSTINFL